MITIIVFIYFVAGPSVASLSGLVR